MWVREVFVGCLVACVHPSLVFLHVHGEQLYNVSACAVYGAVLMSCHMLGLLLTAKWERKTNRTKRLQAPLWLYDTAKKTEVYTKILLQWQPFCPSAELASAVETGQRHVYSLRNGDNVKVYHTNKTGIKKTMYEKDLS